MDQKLADVIDIKWGTKAAVIRAFWASVKKHRLQDPKHPQQINLPMELAQVCMDWGWTGCGLGVDWFRQGMDWYGQGMERG